MAAGSTGAMDGATWCQIQLSAGVSRRHMLVFNFAAFMTLGIGVGFNLLQPDLMTNFLHIDSERQGSVGATSKTLGEVAAIFSSAIIGTLSDKVGRRAVYVGALLVAGLSFGLLPLTPNVPTLCLFTVVNVVGMSTASTMMATIPGDYVVHADRGKANGLVALMNGLGALTLGLLVGRLPTFFHGTAFATADGRGEDRLAYFCMAAVSVATALVLRCGLAGTEVQGDADRERATLGEKLRTGAQLACRDPGVAFSCLVAAVARADQQMTVTFMPQWCVSFALQNAVAAAGLPPGSQLPEEQRSAASQRGSERGSTCVAILGVAGMVAGMVWGRVVDRTNPTNSLCLALLLTAISYGSLSACYDPFADGILVATGLVGLSQICSAVSSIAFVQQHAPPEVRGAILGLFGMSGALGQIVNVFVGGQLFTNWSMRGPWVWMCFVNVLVLLCGLAFHQRLQPPRAGTSGLMADEGCEVEPAS